MRKKLIFPRSGGKLWFHVYGLLQLGEVIEFVEDWFEISSISIISISGDDIRKWRLISRQAVRVFIAYMRNNVGSKNLRLRLKQRKPWDIVP